MEKHIATFAKNKAEEVRIDLTEYQGHDLVSARVWAPSDGTGVKVPTRKGLTLNVRLLPDLIEALQEAEREARAAGLLKESSEAA